MLDLSIYLPPFLPALLLLTASPALGLMQRRYGRLPEIFAPRHFNYLLDNRRSITITECAAILGSALSLAWVVFVTLGRGFLDVVGSALA